MLQSITKPQYVMFMSGVAPANVTKCYKSVTCMLQEYDKSVTTMLQMLQSVTKF